MEKVSLGPVTVDRSALDALCRKWGISRLALFGSALRDDYTTQSDIDFLVEYAPGVRHTLFDYGPMLEEFEHLFGRKVDLVRAAGLRASKNELRKEHIFSSAKEFYVLPS